jgi:hypothetical protein
MLHSAHLEAHSDDGPPLDLYWYYQCFLRDGRRALEPLVSGKETVEGIVGAEMSRDEFDAMIARISSQPQRLDAFRRLLTDD